MLFDVTQHVLNQTVISDLLLRWAKEMLTGNSSSKTMTKKKQKTQGNFDELTVEQRMWAGVRMCWVSGAVR